jgi:class 3 adenylate cyclase
MDIRAPRFEPPQLEIAYRDSRIPGARAMMVGAAAFGAVLFLFLGAWDELIDPGSVAATWPFRVGTTFGFLILLVLTRWSWSLAVLHLLLAVGFGMATIGFALVVGEIENGYIAGVPGFIVAMSAVSVGPVTHRGLWAVLVAASIPPIIVFAARGATGTEMANLALWLVSGVGFVYIAWRVTDATRRRVFLVERAIAAERDKVDSLVRKMVPGPIADRLKDGETNISDRHDEVTVLFADIVGFTRFSESHGPEQIVGLLNALFSRFDALVAEHGLEKIKTLGDGYMVAGGAPLPLADHAAAVVRLALAMRSAMAEFRSEHEVDWELRTGIHSGPVVAGVIGTDRYAYDMWGDTVNVASRLESTGTIGEIQLSGDTARNLNGAFDLASLGLMELKNREPVEAYRLVAG